MCPPKMYSPVLFIYGDLKIMAGENNMAMICCEVLYEQDQHYKKRNNEPHVQKS